MLKLLLFYLLTLLSSLTLFGQTISIIAGTGEQGYKGDSGLATKALLNHPEVIAIDKKGNIYFAESFNNCVRKIDKKGIITTVVGTGETGYNGDSILATKAMLNDPFGVAFDKKGDLLIADTHNRRIRKVDKDGIIYTIAGTGEEEYQTDYGDKIFGGKKLAVETPLGGMFGLAFDKKNNIYIPDFGANCIRVINSEGQISTSKIYYMPDCLFFDKNYSMYVVSNNVIKKMNADTFYTVAGKHGGYGYSGDDSLSTEATFSGLMTATIDKKGNFYLADGLNQCIRMINKKGIVSTIMGLKIDKLYNLTSEMKNIQSLGQPHGITVDNKGYLYVSDTYHNRIIKVKIKRYLLQLKSLKR